MAKGARKKTKWVSLSLASATATTAQPAAADNEADETHKPSRGKKSYTAVVGSASNAYYNGVPKEECNEHGANVSSKRERPTGEDRGCSPHSNSRFPYSHKNYMRYSKNHFSSHNSHYHHSSSNANGKSYYSHHNGTGGYSNRSSAYSSHHTAEAKNEQNETVIINEEEYTKITTPRQDVLFKKGYLSRPKRRTSTANDSGTLGSSVNGGTPTEGSETATGSGSVSTTGSVMSDATYLTEGHFLEYPTPYYGYFDQSGVLVMNGFAVDNNGFSYMNGGQTYIYPPNYNCQPAAGFDQENQLDLEQGEQFSGSNQVQMADMNNTIDDPDGSAINQTVTGTVESVDSAFPGCTSYVLPEESDQTCDNAGAICDNFGTEQQTTEEGTEVSLGTDLEQLVPQQPILSPYVNAYDYAQFYNAYYYPGCVMTPFPVVEDAVYYDQVGFLSEEEYAKQFSFKKRKKWYRGWEEYSMEMPADVPPPEEVVPAETQNLTSSEILTDGTVSQNYNQTQPIAHQLPTDGDSPTNPAPSVHPVAASASPQATQKSDSNRSQPPNPSPSTQGAKKTQKTLRKKDLIESTLAFAEQNIDLTKTAGVAAQQASSANVWRTVRNGREIVEEDRELRYIDTRAMTKMEAIREEISETSSSEAVVCPTQQSEAPISLGNVNAGAKQGKKDERSSKKGKKTAKSKGKKQKKGSHGQQQTGFEVIEPEFVVSVSRYANVVEDVEEDDEDSPETLSLEQTVSQQDLIEDIEEKSENLSLEETISEHDSVVVDNRNMLEDPDTVVLQEQNDDSDVLKLEQDLKEVQISDLRVDMVCDILVSNIQHSLKLDADGDDGACSLKIEETPCYEILEQDSQEQTDVLSIDEKEASNCDTKLDVSCEKLTDNNEELLEEFPVVEISNSCLTTESTKRDLYCSEMKSEENDNDCKHFSEKEYSEDYDSGVQSPAACAVSTTSFGGEERKSSASSSYNDNDSNNLTEAVTSWLSETLRSKRLDEMFILPEDPTLLGRIHQFAVTNFDDILALSSDTFSSSGEDADDADSDYMSDVQVRNRRIENQVHEHNNQKTDNEGDEKLTGKQTANGHPHRETIGGGHSNPKQKRCIIM